MQGIKRRIVYVTLYETIAILFVTVALWALGHESGHAGAAAVVSSAIAIAWNIIWNWLFERWEARQTRKGRSFVRRVAHAIGFEGGLLLAIVPYFAWWLDISLLEAFLLDAGLIVFFLVYTFVFNLAFDMIFGLPASALPAPRPDPEHANVDHSCAAHAPDTHAVTEQKY